MIAAGGAPLVRAPVNVQIRDTSLGVTAGSRRNLPSSLPRDPLALGLRGVRGLRRPAMRSTDTYSTWLAPPSPAGAGHAPVRLTYVEEQVRWGGGARPGTTLADRYELLAPLSVHESGVHESGVHKSGVHTPGAFWQGRRKGSAARAEQITVQLLDSGLVEDLGSRKAFLEEARAAATIEHAHVARVLDYGIHAERGEEVPFLVLEPLVGETLESRLAAQTCLAPEELSRLVAEAARGLDALHGWGLIHRRVDPAHWFLAREPGSNRSRTKLLFAIDDVLGDHLNLVSKLSHQLGYVRGSKRDVCHEGSRRPSTREYQSPEQLLGHDTVDERSDLWSLAVIVFEALTGTSAFEGNTTGERLVQICSGEPNAPPADLALPAGFAAWFQKGVHKRPAQRFASARELADALGRALDPLAPQRS